MLTPHCSAASGMVAPPSIASTTRLRKASEYGFAIHAGLLPVGSLNHIRARMGIPDSAFSGNALISAAALMPNLWGEKKQVEVNIAGQGGVLILGKPVEPQQALPPPTAALPMAIEAHEPTHEPVEA